MWQNLKAAIVADPSICSELGLLRDLPKYNSQGEIVRTPPPVRLPLRSSEYGHSYGLRRMGRSVQR